MKYILPPGWEISKGLKAKVTYLKSQDFSDHIQTVIIWLTSISVRWHQIWKYQKSKFLGGCWRISRIKKNLSSNFEGLSLEKYWWNSCVGWMIDRVWFSPWRWWMIPGKSSFWNFWCDEADSISRMNKRTKKIKYFENKAWFNQIQLIMPPVASVSLHYDDIWDL